MTFVYCLCFEIFLLTANSSACRHLSYIMPIWFKDMWMPIPFQKMRGHHSWSGKKGKSKQVKGGEKKQTALPTDWCTLWYPLGNAQSKLQSVLHTPRFAPLISSIMSYLPSLTIKSAIGEDCKDAIAKKKASEVGSWIKNLIYIRTISIVSDTLAAFSSYCNRSQ